MTSIDLIQGFLTENWGWALIILVVYIAIKVIFIRITHKIHEREKIGLYQCRLLEMIAYKHGVTTEDVLMVHNDIWPPKAQTSVEELEAINHHDSTK